MVLAGGEKAFGQLDRGGAGVGFLCRALAQLDKGVGLFGSCRKDAARAMIFEATPDEAVAVCEQGRGERVAFIPCQVLVIPLEFLRLVAVDQAAFDAVRGAHLDRPRARATSRASSTLVISWVTVLRVTTSQDRSPCS